MLDFTIRFPRIETERLILRRITLKDRFDIKEFYSDEEVMKYYGIYTVEDIEIIESMILDYENGFRTNSFVRWGIELKCEGKIIGTCGFHNWMRKFSRCEMGYEMNKKYWNNGYMSEALAGIIDYAFGGMDINRIEAQTYPENIASYSVLEKLGFKREGLLREYAYFREKFQDLYMYSLLKSETKYSNYYD